MHQKEHTMSAADWPRFVEKADRFYQHMVMHYDEYFREDGSLRDYFMHFASYPCMGYHHRVDKDCGEQIHAEIVPWIHAERASGRLFAKENWKAFRDQDNLQKSYAGYRKLFLFHDFFYFQLTLDEDVYGQFPDGSYDMRIDFHVALYGWKDKEKRYVQPMDRSIIDEDMWMPERDWKRE